LRKIRYILPFILLQIFSVQIANAQKIDSKISSMFLFYFTKYIEWPQAEDQIKLAIYADDKEYTALRSILLKKQFAGKTLVITQLKDKQTAVSYNLLFIASNKSNDIKALVQNCAQSSTVVVAEKIGATKKGSGIELYLDEDDDNKTKFIINKKLLESKGLKLSTQLISLSN
jgi:hypothetical protein